MENILFIALYVVAIIAFFYFVMIRPEKKRTKQMEEMKKSVKVGDKISTIGGVIGVVVSENDEKIVLETGADRVRIEFGRWAIGGKYDDRPTEK